MNRGRDTATSETFLNLQLRQLNQDLEAAGITSHRVVGFHHTDHLPEPVIQEVGA